MHPLARLIAGCAFVLIAWAVGWFVAGSVLLFTHTLDSPFGSLATFAFAGGCAIVALLLVVWRSQRRG
jgi:predicted RND superfamily exporter protein